MLVIMVTVLSNHRALMKVRIRTVTVFLLPNLSKSRLGCDEGLSCFFRIGNEEIPGCKSGGVVYGMLVIMITMF